MEGFKKYLNLIMKNIYLYLYNSVVSRVEGQIQKDSSTDKQFSLYSIIHVNLIQN